MEGKRILQANCHPPKRRWISGLISYYNNEYQTKNVSLQDVFRKVSVKNIIICWPHFKYKDKKTFLSMKDLLTAPFVRNALWKPYQKNATIKRSYNQNNFNCLNHQYYLKIHILKINENRKSRKGKTAYLFRAGSESILS